MLKCFPIDFIRQVLAQELLIQHKINPNYFGGKDQVSILSFYEQLKNQDDVDRFVETYRDLTEQQNRTGLILNGVIVSPENPTITNLYSSLIVPMTWSLSFRCKLENRDQAIVTINNVIEQLKGRKVDVAQLKCLDDDNKEYYQPFMVGTLGQVTGTPYIKDYDYIGDITLVSEVDTLLTNLANDGFDNTANVTKLYANVSNSLKLLYKEDGSWSIVEDSGDIDAIFPTDNSEFEKYKLSISFDAIRCDEPRNLNANEYCEITIGGNATLVSSNVKLGNDLLKIGIQKYKIQAQYPVTFSSAPIYYLEPLEMPSGNSANAQINQVVSNKFMSMSHVDAISLTLQYTFIFDEDNDLLKQLFYYGRYGTQGLTVNDISPNMLYYVTEIWCSWGVYETHTVVTKLVEDIEIENTESDTLTLGISMQIQGDI